MICRVNEEEEEEEREPRGEMMNESPLFLSVHSEISFLPAPYFFFFSLGDDKSSGKFLIERTRR